MEGAKVEFKRMIDGWMLGCSSGEVLVDQAWNQALLYPPLRRSSTAINRTSRECNVRKSVEEAMHQDNARPKRFRSITGRPQTGLRTASGSHRATANK